MIKSIALAASAAFLFASATPAAANAFDRYEDGTRGISATVNLKIPFGGKAGVERPNYGMTLNYGRSFARPGLDGRVVTRAATLADLRFNGDGLAKAQVASFDLRQAGKTADPRLRLFDGPLGPPEYAILGGAAVIVALLVL